MAPDKDILIEIQADDNGSAKVVRQNTDAIQSLDKSSKKAGKGVNYLGKQTYGLRDGTKGANLAMMDLGRVVQDLPYGIRGVANNIDPLVNSLQRVKSQTGSWKSAAGSLVGSLTGPAGIALAVSTVTSILVSFGPQIAEWFGIFDDGKEEVDDAIKSIQDLKKELSFFESRSKPALDLVERAFPDAKGIEKQKLELQVLRRLQDQIIQQRTNLGGAGDVEGRINELDTLINKFETVGKRGESILKNQGFIAIDSNFEETLADLKERRENVQERINVLTKDEQRIKNEIFQKQVDQNQQVLFLNSELGKSLQKQAKFAQGQEDSKEYEKARLKSLEKSNEQLRETGLLLEENARKKAAATDVAIDMPELNLSNDGNKPLSFAEMAGATEQQRNALMRYNEELARSNALTQEHADKMLFQYQASEALSKGIEHLAEQSLVAFGETLGQVLAGDIEGDPFTKFKLVFADFMSFFGQALIALGVGSKQFRKFLSNPVAAIAAGTALVAAASYVRSSTQDKVNSLTGGGGSQRAVGYRGLDFSGANGSGDTNTQGAASAALSGQNEQPVKYLIMDGFGNVVMKGREEIEQKGGSNYVRGDR